MRFKIVSAGWRCADWWERTLRSIEDQSVDNWDVWIIYDGGDNAGVELQAWVAERDERWNVTITTEQRFAVQNQYEAITCLAPEDDDVIVFLDLDGDMFAHPEVLAHLTEYYADGTLVTYGSYEPVPKVLTCTPASPYPEKVVRTNTYRIHTSRYGCCFNHLRTMKGRIFKAIPVEQFQWANSGRFYESGTDYVFMTAALELAGGRYKCIPEVLLLYNHANPYAEYLARPYQDGPTRDFLARPPLNPLP